jgi:hypothetical protein
VFSACELFAEMTMALIIYKVTQDQGIRKSKKSTDWLAEFDHANAAIISKFIAQGEEQET